MLSGKVKCGKHLNHTNPSKSGRNGARKNEEVKRRTDEHRSRWSYQTAGVDDARPSAATVGRCARSRGEVGSTIGRPSAPTSVLTVGLHWKMFGSLSFFLPSFLRVAFLSMEKGSTFLAAGAFDVVGRVSPLSRRAAVGGGSCVSRRLSPPLVYYFFF